MAQRKKKGSNRIIWILLALALILGGAAFYLKSIGKIGGKKLTKVATQLVEKRTILETVKASGKVYPVTELKISPDVSGEVIELYVEDGDTVKKGMLLAKIDQEIYLSQLERAQATVNNSKAGKASSSARKSQVEVAVEKARINFNRQKRLYQEKVISQAEYENAESTYLSAQADLDAATQNIEASNFQVESLQATVKEAKDNLRKTNIYAPMSGIISRLNVKKGERVVGTTQMAGTEMMRIADFDEMEVRVDVSENDILRIELRDSVDIEIDAYSDIEFKGIVYQIANSAGSGSLMSADQVTNFEVKIKILKESYASLIESKKRFPFRPGMSASGEILTERLKNIMTVPIQAVTTRAEDKDDEKSEMEEVVYVNQGGMVFKKKVKLGIQDESYIEIKSGLRDNDEIVTDPFRVVNKELEDSLEIEVVDKDELFKSDKKK